MQVTQVKDLVNNITAQILGKEDILNEDLSNVVDVGKELFSATSVDNYVKTLVDHIGKVIFVDRTYAGNAPSVLMDGWEFGSVLEKIQAELPNATENSSWDLTDGETYTQDIFYKPSVSAKFFNDRVTFEIPISITERQVKSSFSSAEQLNGFISMLYNSVENAMTVKLDGLIMRTINNMIAHTVYDAFPDPDTEHYSENSYPRAVNLYYLYKKAQPEGSSTPTTAEELMRNPEFIRFAAYTMGLYEKRLSKISSLFNVGGKARFTPADKLHVTMLSDFASAANVYLQSDTFHNEFTALPNAETVPFWQGSGDSFAFDDVSSINVSITVPTEDGTEKVDVALSGILAVMWDRDALGVTNMDRRVTTHYNAKAEFFNNFYKMDAGYFNDLNENFVVFYVAIGEEESGVPDMQE